MNLTLFLQIGGNSCANVRHALGREHSELTCQLPAVLEARRLNLIFRLQGVGLRQSVVISRNLIFSQSTPLVDYASATIFRVSGCIDSRKPHFLASRETVLLQ